MPSRVSVVLAIACIASHIFPCFCTHAGHPHWLLGLADLPTGQQVRVHVMQADSNLPEQEQLLLKPRMLPSLDSHVPSKSAHIQQAEEDDVEAKQHAGGAHNHGGPHRPRITLGAVADIYGISADRLQLIMQQDDNLRATPQGLLVWSCSTQEHSHHLPSPDGGTGIPQTTAAAAGKQLQQPQLQRTSRTDGDSSSTTGDIGKNGNSYATISSAATSAHQEEAEQLERELVEGDEQQEQVQQATEDTTDDTRAVLMAAVDVASSHTRARAPQTAPAAWWQHQRQPRPEDAFRLHSRPQGAVQHTIFLDFRGCSISDSWWNAATSKPLLQTQPFDLDGDVSSFSQQERQAVVDIWLAVVQDFAPWAVDVVTEDPGQDALIRSDEADQQHGMHVCIGGSSATTVGGMAGGLAFTGAWGQVGPGLQPVLVFPAQLGNGHARAVADSISHEIGHTLSLSHFGGQGAAPYNEGSGAWGPLLGQPYARHLSLWSRGLAVSGSQQDDLQAISTQLLPASDDHGDSPATATRVCAQGDGMAVAGNAQPGAVCQQHSQPAAAPGSSTSRPEAASIAAIDAAGTMSARITGIVSSADDRDVFRVDVAQPGRLRAQLQLPHSRCSPELGINNLVASVVISSTNGQVLAAGRPVTGAEVTVQAVADILMPGACYLTVAPAAVPGTSSNYGSLGNYVLLINYPAPTRSKQLDINTHTDSVDEQHPGAAGRVGAPGQSRSPALPSLLQAQPATGTHTREQVVALDFSSSTCCTAAAGALVLLRFVSGSPPVCAQGSTLAAAPRTELLPGACPCHHQPLRLPMVEMAGSSGMQDGSYSCEGGVYSYRWHVPSVPGCYRLIVQPMSGGSIITVLQAI